MRKLSVPALGLTCLFALTAGAAVSKKVVASAPNNVAATAIADPGTDDGMPRVAPDQTRHKVIRHPKRADDDVFYLEGIGDGDSRTLWGSCNNGMKCVSNACSTGATYNKCQSELYPDTNHCQSCS